jgi:hypothetical protein
MSAIAPSAAIRDELRGSLGCELVRERLMVIDGARTR